MFIIKPDHVRDVDLFIHWYGMRGFGPSAGGLLRIWWTPVLERRALPALRALLDLPFEHVLVSHGEPVHTRADFEVALEREPWSREEGS